MIDCEDHGQRAREAYERPAYQAYLRAVRDRTEALVRERCTVR